jgi:hypothetical protein
MFIRRFIGGSDVRIQNRAPPLGHPQSGRSGPPLRPANPGTTSSTSLMNVQAFPGPRWPDSDHPRPDLGRSKIRSASTPLRKPECEHRFSEFLSLVSYIGLKLIERATSNFRSSVESSQDKGHSHLINVESRRRQAGWLGTISNLPAEITNRHNKNTSMQRVPWQHPGL